MAGQIRKSFRLAPLALLLLAPPAWAAAPLAGTWFGTGQPDDKSEMYLDSLEPNGDFHAHHRWCVKGKAMDQYQKGRWSLKGDILTISIRTVNGVAQARDDIYRMLSHDGQSQHYVYLPLNFAYSSRRVEETFEMPSCELVS